MNLGLCERAKSHDLRRESYTVQVVNVQKSDIYVLPVGNVMVTLNIKCTPHVMYM